MELFSIRIQRTFQLVSTPLDDMNVHFMAVPADRMVTVDIPVAVYEILHVTVVLLIARHDITEIHCFCFNEQCE